MAVQEGEFQTGESELMSDALRAAGLNPEYVAIRRALDLSPPHQKQNREELVILAAVHLGRARLIDNIVVTT